MAKKVKTPIYKGLRALAVVLLSTSKIITGPWGWFIKPTILWGLDYLIKPLFVKMRKSKILKKFKKKSKKATQDFQDAETNDEIMDAFDDLP